MVASARARGQRRRGGSPLLLDHIKDMTGGASVEVSLQIARGDIGLAGQIARALTTLGQR
jgi:pseudouridine-5'-phosphate glycosidase